MFFSPCIDDPCVNGGMCNSIDGKFVCECPYAHFGARCEHTNLCVMTSPCGPHGVMCHNTSDTSYRCICEAGKENYAIHFNLYTSIQTKMSHHKYMRIDSIKNNNLYL